MSNITNPVAIHNRLFVVETKYLGPTNNRGSRIKAWFSHDPSYFKPVTVSYPCHLSGEHAHYEAVKALLERHKDKPFVNNLSLIGTCCTNIGYMFIFGYGDHHE